MKKDITLSIKYEQARLHAAMLEKLLSKPTREIEWFHSVADHVKAINELLPFVEAVQ